MTPCKTLAAHELLFRNWFDCSLLDGLPDDLRPASMRDGYAIQAHIERSSNERRFGWKIAATSEAGQRHIGVDGPIVGRLLAERVLPDGGDCSLTGNQMRVAEPEFAFRMRHEVQPRLMPYTREEVLAMVGGLHPAIEIPDSRFRGFERVGGPQIAADNACAHLFVLGPASMADWRALDLASHPATVAVNNDAVYHGIGRNVLGDPLIALTWFVNMVSTLGITIQPGEVITTGTCAPPVAVEPGQRVEADFGPFGKVSINFT